MLGEAREVKGVKVLAKRLEGVSGKELRGLLDQLKNKLGSGIVVLGVGDEQAGKVSLIAGVTDDLTGQVKAGELVNHVASQVGGKGGGRPDMAQAGGSDVPALPVRWRACPYGSSPSSDAHRGEGVMPSASVYKDNRFHSNVNPDTRDNDKWHYTYRSSAAPRWAPWSASSRGREGQGLP